MSWLEKCLTRCTFIPPDTMDMQKTYVPIKPHKPREPKTYKHREHRRVRDIQCLQSYKDNVSLILTPKCEGKSPHEHRFSFSDISVSPYCSSCFEKGIENHKLFVLCKECEYTLCQECYKRDVSPYLSEISC